MLLKRHFHIFLADTASVIGYSDIISSAISYFYNYMVASGVYGVLYQLLNYRCRSVHNLTRRDFAYCLLLQDENVSHDSLQK